MEANTSAEFPSERKQIVWEEKIKFNGGKIYYQKSDSTFARSQKNTYSKFK